MPQPGPLQRNFSVVRLISQELGAGTVLAELGDGVHPALGLPCLTCLDILIRGRTWISRSLSTHLHKHSFTHALVDGFGRLPTVHLFAERAVVAARRMRKEVETQMSGCGFVLCGFCAGCGAAVIRAKADR